MAATAARPLVRPAVADDLDAVTGLVRALGYPSAAAAVAERLASYDGSARDTVLVAEVDEVVRGVVAVSLTPSLVADRSSSRVTALVVDPARRRVGVGAALLDAAEEWAAARGSDLMQINCGRRPERTAAHSLYRAHGYVDQHVHHILYERRLTAHPDT